MNISTAYRNGFFSAKDGPNTYNTHFSNFATPELTKAWETGGDDFRKGLTTMWVCPSCKLNNPTRYPKTEDDVAPGRDFWDSSKQCGCCGELAFVVIYMDGRTISSDIHNGNLETL